MTGNRPHDAQHVRVAHVALLDLLLDHLRALGGERVLRPRRVQGKRHQAKGKS